MQVSDIPAKFNIPFANSATAPYIRTVPQASQIGIQDGAASLTDGYPPDTFIAIGAGGVPPFGSDTNGILNQISAWCRWLAAGGPIGWDSAYAAIPPTGPNGYPKGAIVQAAIPGNAWISTTDNNVTNPDTGGAGWSSYGLGTGDAKLTLKTTADYGWLLMADGMTIGNASSNATYANAFASALFALVWTGINNTYAPLLDSTGTPTARGASAAADFAANRQITLPLQYGRAIAIAGAGSGLTSHLLGQTGGAESATLSQANLPSVNLTTTIAAGQGSHGHPGSTAPISTGSNYAAGGGAGPAENTGGTTGLTIATATLPAMTGNTPLGGSGNPVPTVAPETFWNVMIKL